MLAMEKSIAQIECHQTFSLKFVCVWQIVLAEQREHVLAEDKFPCEIIEYHQQRPLKNNVPIEMAESVNGEFDTSQNGFPHSFRSGATVINDIFDFILWINNNNSYKMLPIQKVETANIRYSPVS